MIQNNSQFKKLTKRERRQFIKNLSPNYSIKKGMKLNSYKGKFSMVNMLQGAFVWSWTPEGNEYWNNIKERIK